MDFRKCLISLIKQKSENTIYMINTNTIMKTRLLNQALLVLALLFSTLAQATQLNGTYTIDPVAPATTTNFRTFASAITYMTATTARADGGPVNTAPLGISGPVTFNVAAATYTVTAAISVPAITGASPINTITFEGTSNVNRIITGSLNTTTIWQFNLCKYVKVRNLTIINTSTTNCGVVVFYNNTTTGSSATSSPAGSCNTIQNCDIRLPNHANLTLTSSCIAASNSLTGYSFSTQYADSTIIDGNTTTNGYYAIALYGASNTSYNRGVQVTNNKVINASYYGVYWYYHYNPCVLDNNDITVSNVSSGSGVYFYYNNNNNTTQSSFVTNNKVRAPYGGIWMYYANGMITSPTMIKNNLIICGTYSTNYGLYNVNNAANYQQIVHNTIVTNTGSGYGMYYSGGSVTGQVIKGNIFANYGGGTLYPAYFGTNPTGNVINYNVYWSTAANLLYRGAAYTAANYQTATAGGDSSFNVNPSFMNMNYSAGTSDAHLQDGCGAKGIFMAGITPPNDVDGEPRSVIAPMIGADEAGGLINDLFLTKVLSPTIPITLGLQDVVVRVRNVGTNVINSFDLSYKLNAEPVVSQTWTGTLNPCDEIQVVMTGPNQVNLVSSNNLKVYTSGPNGNLDNRRNNDSSSLQLFAPLSGNYTIGGTTPDFINFAQATNALASGIMGPVTFDVRPGTYAETVVIPAAAGSSPVNTVTFTGQDVNTTIIQANASSLAVVRLNGCKYTTFQNMSVRNLSSSGAGIAVIGNAANNAGGSNTIKKCSVTLVSGTGTQYPFVMTATATGYGITSNKVDSLTLDSNVFTNGYYGLYVYGYTTTGEGIFNRDIKIRGNTLNNMYYMGMYLYYLSGGLTVQNNKVNMTTTLSQTNQYGIYAYMYNYIAVQYKGITSIFDGNVVDANYYAMYLYYPYGTYNNPLRITNNIIKPAFARYSGGGYYGMYLYLYGSVIVSDPTPTCLIYHNTIYHNGSPSGYGFYFAGDGGTMQPKTDIKNNIFACSNTSGGAAYIGSNPNAGNPSAIDYNVYYRQGGGNTLYRNGIWYNQDNVVSFAGGGSNSFYLNPPPFVNLAGGDLHISNACTRGMNTSGWVPTDVDGEVRGNLPNIGADEYPGLDLDVSVDAVVSPSFPVGTGTQNLVLRIRNNGSTVINSVNVSYSLNNAPPVTIPWVGTLNPCEGQLITFDGMNQIDIPNLNNMLVAYTSNPNGAGDQNRTNDTLKTNALAPPLRGDYIIAATGGDFINLTNAVGAVGTRGIGGHVNFIVAQGTYTEPAAVNFSNVVGLSDTSRISIYSQSGNYGNTIIQSNASPVIGITGSSFIRFNGLTLKQNVVGGNVMNIGGVVSNIEVTNCNLDGPITTTTSYVLNIAGVLSKSTFKKSIFKGCYYGIYMQGTSTYAGQMSDIIIDSNTITQVGIYCWYLLYTRDLKVRGNTINMNNGTNTYSYLYGPMYPDSALEVSNNIINVTTGYYYAYYLGYYGNGGYLPTSRSKIFNNTFNMLGTSYGYWYYWGYYGNRQDYYNNKMVNASSSNYNYVYYTGYYSNGTRFYNNVLPMNSGYLAYTGYTSGAGSKWFNNTIHSTTTYTHYYHYAGTNTGEGFEMKNNIMTNSGSGNVIYTSGTLNAFDKFDYNNFYTTGTVMFTGGQTFNNMSAMKAAGYCKNCLSFDAGYTNINTNLTPNPTNANSWSANGQGQPTSWITNDINGNPRSTMLSTGASDLGAIEFTPTAIPPACVLTPATPPSIGGPQVVTFGLDTVARIVWAGGSVPTSATVRLYSGTNPMGIVYAGGNYMNAYWDISVSPASSYNYTLELYHKGIWQGTNPSAENMIGAQNTGGAWNFLYTSANSVEFNKLSINNLTGFGQFTGTDATTPFTPSFMVLSDKNKQNVMSQPLSVYPNPFGNELNVKLDLTTEGTVTLNLMDITGKSLVTKTEFMKGGLNQTTLNGMNDLKAGIYFLTVEMNGQSFVQKLVKH